MGLKPVWPTVGYFYRPRKAVPSTVSRLGTSRSLPKCYLSTLWKSYQELLELNIFFIHDTNKPFFKLHFGYTWIKIFNFRENTTGYMLWVRGNGSSIQQSIHISISAAKGQMHTFEFVKTRRASVRPPLTFLSSPWPQR